MYKKLITILFSLGLSNFYSQTKLTGKITDESNNPISSATIKVKEESIGVKTDLNGSYSIVFPKTGTYKLIISSLGFASEEATITIAENQTIEKSYSLKSLSKKVKNVTVTGQKTKSSETATLSEQKQSTQIIEVMGSQEMSRKGASDAQAAVTKMAGISKEEGSSQIFVRGLGDRYNSTMLNGMFLPSDNPEFKNISLEYFPIDVIQSIQVSKTYNNTLLGDFGGATINISTKEFTSKPFLNLSFKSGLNTQSVANKNLGSGLSYFGGVEQSEIPTNVNGAYFDRNWNPEERSMPKINNDININGGWSHSFSDKIKLSLFGTASMSNKFQYFEGMSKIVDAQANIKDSAFKESYTYSVNQNAMINSTLVLSEKFKTKLNFLTFRTAANQWNDYNGYDGSSGLQTYRRRNIKDISTLNILQWINEFKYNQKLSLLVNLSYNDIENNQPDRLSQSYNYFSNNWLINTNQAGNMGSYYQKLNDKDYSINAMGRYVLGADSVAGRDKTVLNIGYTLRKKERLFEQYEYIFKSSVPNPSGYVLPTDIALYFNQANHSAGKYTIFGERISAGKVLPSTYNGDLIIHSPNFNLEHTTNNRLTLSGGIRLDLISQQVIWDVVSNSPIKGFDNFDDFKILPYLNAKYVVNDFQNLKFSFSKTYTLPQFKELAPFLYNDISTFNSRGNPFLYTSDNYNFDLKWEKFPTKTELISVSGFSKFIQNPINKIFEAATGTPQMTYANSGDLAMVVGIEFELKKNFLNKMNVDSNKIGQQLTGGFNFSALYSHQDLNTSKVVAETKDKFNNSYTSPVFTYNSSTLQGASPIVFNFDLTYRLKIKNYEPQATLTLNYFHDRLYAIGAQTAGNAYEKGVMTLDLITKHTFSKKIQASFNIRNILNPSIERYQEFKDYDLTISQFNRGIDFSAGINISIQ